MQMEILIGKSGHQMVDEYQEQSREIKLFLQELLLTDMEVNGENIHHQQEYHMNKGVVRQIRCTNICKLSDRYKK